MERKDARGDVVECLSVYDIGRWREVAHNVEAKMKELAEGPEEDESATETGLLAEVWP